MIRRETREKNKRICGTCNKVFIKDYASKGLFCSHSCYAISLKVRGEKPNCLDCGKKLSAHSCSRCLKCSSKLRTGEGHSRWIKDRTKLSRVNKQGERRTSAYLNWRKQVWLRDNFTCKIANPDCSGRIEAHHILGWADYPELRYQLNNGITLCHAHHPRKRAEEKRLSPYFQELVSVSNRQF